MFFRGILRGYVLGEEDVEIYHKEDAIGSRNCFTHLKKTLSALHERGGTLEDAKKYLLMPMTERSVVIDEQGGNTLAFFLLLCFSRPRCGDDRAEFGVDFWVLWDELGADIPSVERFPSPQPCPPVEPVSTQELFGVAPDDMAYYWRSDGKVHFSDEMTAWMQALRAELDGITDTIPPERFLQAMADAIPGAGNYAFRICSTGSLRGRRSRRYRPPFFCWSGSPSAASRIFAGIWRSSGSRAAGESVRFLKRHTL